MNRKKLIVSGNGRDGNNESMVTVAGVIIGILAIIIAIAIINTASDYHGFGGLFGERVYGIRFGNNVLRASPAKIVATILIISGVIGAISSMKPQFNSEISIFEDSVSGVCKNKEKFELKYSEISYVSTQNDGSWKSININASGKTFQVYTVKCNEIASEINKRRDSINITAGQQATAPIAAAVPAGGTFCPMCGYKLADTNNAAFCPGCGAKIGIPQSASQNAVVSSTATRNVCSKCGKEYPQENTACPFCKFCQSPADGLIKCCNCECFYEHSMPSCVYCNTRNWLCKKCNTVNLESSYFCVKCRRGKG